LHPRIKIKDSELEPDDKLECTLLSSLIARDGTIQMNDQESLWYDQAFGTQRNIMHISIKYMPDDEMTKKQKGLRVIGEAKYKMFPELYDEFNVGDYEREFEIEMNLMDPEKDKDGNEM